MRSLQDLRQRGFTIVELLIVIVVIGILAALVITTFSGIQQRARNTERETDIKALHSQLEAYYAQYGHYPTLANLNDESFRGEFLRGLDDGALIPPNSDDEPEATASQDHYGYAPAPDGCDNSDGNTCQAYVLTAVREGSDDYVKDSLNTIVEEDDEEV